MIKLIHNGQIVGSINPTYIAAIGVICDKTKANQGEVENDLHYSGLRFNYVTNEYYFPGIVQIKTCSGSDIRIGTHNPFALATMLSTPANIEQIDIDYFIIS